MKPTMLVLAALLAAAPALAQPAPPPPPGQFGGPGMPGRDQRRGERMFPSMSEAGRTIMKEAMMAGSDRGATRAKVEAARDRMMAALDADRFDAAAVKRAMDEERALAEATKMERQAAMLAAFGKLSTADRKAFVADSRAMKDRMDKRMRDWRERLRDRRDRRGAPPPPPASSQDGAPGTDSALSI